MSTEWGWWTSDGRTNDRAKVRKHIQRSVDEDGKRPLNEICIEEHDIRINSSVNEGLNMNESSFVEPFECGQTCSPDNETHPDCTCKTDADGNKECRFWCKEEPFRSGIFMDECGLPRKVTRCPGFQRQITCEKEFDEMLQELKDTSHTRTQIKISPQCQACRPLLVHSIRHTKATIKIEKML